MKNLLSKTKSIPSIVAVGLVFAGFLFAFNSAPQKAFAASCDGLSGEDKAKCDGSIQECGSGDKDADKACRKAYREGWDQAMDKKGEGKSSFCEQSKNREKNACKAGITGGNGYYKNHQGGGSKSGTTSFPGDKGSYQCGNLNDKDENVKTKINFGCLGTKAPGGTGPIEDLFYALIRFLTNGVGVAMVIALIGAGILYTTSQGNAEQTIKSKRRIQNIVIALFIYLFIYAIVQFLVPGGVFK